MAKSRKNSSIVKTMKKSLPVVNKGLKTVGTTAKTVAEASIPVIEKGVSAVYGTMATGLDLGVKMSKKVYNQTKKGTRKHRGGKRRRVRSRRHRR